MLGSLCPKALSRARHRQAMKVPWMEASDTTRAPAHGRVPCLHPQSANSKLHRTRRPAALHTPKRCRSTAQARHLHWSRLAPPTNDALTPTLAPASVPRRYRHIDIGAESHRWATRLRHMPPDARAAQTPNTHTRRRRNGFECWQREQRRALITADVAHYRASAWQRKGA